MKGSSNRRSFAFIASLLLCCCTCSAQFVTIWDRETKAIRDNAFPHFTGNYGDYTQYVPAVGVVALKLSGVESRDEWLRLGSSVLTAGIMSGSLMVGLKYGVGRLRPNEVNTQSFPSGHSCFSFANAAILGKEYGWRSPWYTIGGYTFATITATQRVASNWHWATDTFFGAAIGVLGVQLGYYLNDLMWGKKGLTKGYIDIDYEYEPDNYTLEWFYGRRFFVGTQQMGYPDPSLKQGKDFGESGFCYPTSGATCGIQGEIPTWYSNEDNESSGVKARIAASSISHRKTDNLALNGTSEEDSFNLYTTAAGAYYRKAPLRWLELEAYALAGATFRGIHNEKPFISPDVIAGTSVNLLTWGSNTFKIKGFTECEMFRFARNASMISSITAGLAVGFWW